MGEVTEAMQRARVLAYAVDVSTDELGGDIGTCSYRNPDGPEIYALLVAAISTGVVLEPK